MTRDPSSSRDAVPFVGDHGRCHVVGAAGTGMNALAQVLLARGWDVTGSDRYYDHGEKPAVLDKLERIGLRLVPQDGSSITDESRVVVVSSAIEDDNPDLVAARDVGARVCGRAEMLAGLSRYKRCIAIAGTSGKTTVTGMVGWVLAKLGADPTVVNGGAILGWESEDAVGNVRIGESGLFVVEADESDRSLLLFEPEWAVVTNISKDHFSLTEATELFRRFCLRVKSGIVGGPDAPPLVVTSVEHGPTGSSFDYCGVRFEVGLPGRCNVDNAASAIALCECLGFKLPEIKEALASFRGVERRLQVIGSGKGITVIDDYAHNPAKIRGTWESVARHHERVICVWRPHGFGPLAFMRDELAATVDHLCRDEDMFCVLPVYYAGGTANKSVTAVMFVADLRAREVASLFMRNYEACVEYVKKEAKEGDVVLVMGARDPDLPLLAQRIASACCTDEDDEDY